MATTSQHRSNGETGRDVYSFTLLLDGITSIDESVEGALFNAGCDDAVLGMTDGKAYLCFDREAESLEEAIYSSITAVESTNRGIQVSEVVPPGNQVFGLVNALLMIRRRRPERMGLNEIKDLVK